MNVPLENRFVSQLIRAGFADKYLPKTVYVVVCMGFVK